MKIEACDPDAFFDKGWHTVDEAENVADHLLSPTFPVYDYMMVRAGEVAYGVYVNGEYRSLMPQHFNTFMHDTPWPVAWKKSTWPASMMDNVGHCIPFQLWIRTLFQILDLTSAAPDYLHKTYQWAETREHEDEVFERASSIAYRETPTSTEIVEEAIARCIDSQRKYPGLNIAAFYPLNAIADYHRGLHMKMQTNQEICDIIRKTIPMRVILQGLTR